MTSQVLQASVNFEDNIKDDSTKKDKPYKIFFQDLFLYKQNELAAKKKEKILNRSMKVHQKTTFSSRMKSRSHLSQIAFHSDTDDISFEKLGLDPMLILKLTETADTKRTLHEFISDQRERFLLEYTLSTKRNTIKRLEKHIAVKEMQLKKAEQKLQDNALAFEEFLRENDQQSADAMKIAAQETINKLQMTAELKKASMEVQAMKSEIANKEFLLWEYMKYGFFLLKLSPKHWQIQQALKRSQTSKIHSLLPKLLTRKQLKKPTLNPEARRSPVSNLPASIGSDDSLEFFLDDDMDFALLPELYFKEPEELLQVLTDLEEQNLTLVQYSQDVAENLEEVNKREKVIQDKINSNIEFLLEHKEVLKASCLREEEKAAELELRSRLFSFGEFNSDAQEKLIDSLSKKINQVYKVCIGDGEVGSLNPVQKLVKVESRLVELSDLIESVPKENVEAIERLKQKERRQKLRDEKIKEKQRYQEERLKAALERAVAQPKKKVCLLLGPATSTRLLMRYKNKTPHSSDCSRWEDDLSTVHNLHLVTNTKCFWSVTQEQNHRRKIFFSVE
ncbi:coiled-coil domain-containing protein 38 isoform X1 [Heterocephalus glaber]|uniref:Coiled-coil domain-containing protein 38 isoform X1 n=1 Tax=Heterocephalus glaber TaxID=10181 RepID=A0AAX6P6F0_HETGA|nr:coiled-coil domain-containing protein 38 isoform X1 [Heterocephalus glaber]XP_021114109.1 coiled-coil domain-containing protein 38 isoform X1 [Heterocephalus glaber]